MGSLARVPINFFWLESLEAWEKIAWRAKVFLLLRSFVWPPFAGEIGRRFSILFFKLTTRSENRGKNESPVWPAVMTTNSSSIHSFGLFFLSVCVSPWSDQSEPITRSTFGRKFESVILETRGRWKSLQKYPRLDIFSRMTTFLKVGGKDVFLFLCPRTFHTLMSTSRA